VYTFHPIARPVQLLHSAIPVVARRSEGPSRVDSIVNKRTEVLVPTRRGDQVYAKWFAGSAMPARSQPELATCIPTMPVGVTTVAQ